MAQKSSNEVTATIMALRETLMDYYKSGCVERLTTNSQIYVSAQYNLRGRRRPYQYEQLQQEQKQTQLVSIKDVPLMTMQKRPDELILHMMSLDRSTQLKALREGVERFMAEYLSGVIVRHNNTAKVHHLRLKAYKTLKDDSGLLTAKAKTPVKNFGKYNDRVMVTDNGSLVINTPIGLQPVDDSISEEQLNDLIDRIDEVYGRPTYTTFSSPISGNIYSSWEVSIDE